MRSAQSFKNAAVSTIAQIFNMLLAVVSRTIFVQLLATEYLGLSGLFTNILSVLSLSELGIGNAIIINLYKPLADKDELTIARYMNYYAKAYRVIGIVILLFGFLSMPFLHYMVNTEVSIPHIRLIYFLFVANSAVSYFFAYRRTILTVDQKEYINTVNRNVFLLIQHVVQIVVLLITHSYILYVVTMLLCTFLSNVHIALITGKRYPYLKNKQAELAAEQKKDLLKSIKAILFQKIGNVLVNSTDNIIISVILGVYWVGMYSNYSMIVGIILTFALILFAACSASIGNLNAEASTGKVYSVYKVMSFLSVWIYGFCSICFLCLFQPFIQLWIGEQFLLDFAVVFIIVLAFFLKGIISINTTFLDVTKLFINTRWVPLIMAFINVMVSIFGAYYLGLIGVFLGTVVSYVTTQLWIYPMVLYKHKFEKPIGEYIRFMLPQLLVLLAAGVIAYVLVGMTELFILKVLICFVVPNGILALTWHRTDEMRYLYTIIKALLNQRRTLKRDKKG